MNKWIFSILGVAFTIVIFVFAYRIMEGSSGKAAMDNIQGEVGVYELGKTKKPEISARSEECIAEVISVPAKSISTNSSNTIIAAGDAEIDSNDWTSVGLSYSIKLPKGNRRVELSLKWFAQERNSNKSKGNTRFESNKTFTLYEIDDKCPNLMIKELKGLDISSKREKYYSGELRNFIPFPDTGSLQNIRVQVDEEGKHDNRVQALEGTLQGFSVHLVENTNNVENTPTTQPTNKKNIGNPDPVQYQNKWIEHAVQLIIGLIIAFFAWMLGHFTIKKYKKRFPPVQWLTGRDVMVQFNISGYELYQHIEDGLPVYDETTDIKYKDAKPLEMEEMWFRLGSNKAEFIEHDLLGFLFKRQDINNYLK